jgi:hypothetical protein
MSGGTVEQAGARLVQQIRSGDETVQIGRTAFLGVELVPAYAESASSLGQPVVTPG